MRHPDQIIPEALAHEENGPVIRRVCLTSGGGDSTVLAHRCQFMYDELVHIDTGTALPGVRDFVEMFAREVVNKPLRVVEARDAFIRLVLGHDEWWPIYFEHRIMIQPKTDVVLPQDSRSAERLETPDEFRRRTSKLPTRKQRMGLGVHLAPIGFPGPAGHNFAYQRLKERQLEQALRDIKVEFGNGSRRQRVALYSGVRMAESERRKMTSTAQGEWERRGNQVWINPLIEWPNSMMRQYRRLFRLPVSDATALTHRSGECNCGSFASDGEREELMFWYPDWFEENIGWLEREAEARGLESAKWGQRPQKTGKLPATGPMCSSCDARMALEQASHASDVGPSVLLG